MAFLTHSLVPTGADCICLSDASLKREAGPQKVLFSGPGC